MTEPKTIAGRYEVRGTIGSGARGQVYLAHDPLLNTAVAIKMLHSSGSDDAVVRFQNEAVATGRLKHPRVAQTLDFGIADGALYMVMEFVDGESLAQLLERLTVLPIERALPLFVDICAGLGNAHASGILHRDLKPANVIVVQSQEEGEYAKLVDFGIAKIQGADLMVTDPDAIVGSPIYMSPEQCRSRPADVRSDIYSLGCLMFETLSGKPPLMGDTAIDTIRLKADHDAPELSSVMDTANLPEEIVRIIHTCLRRNPEARFQNVPAINQALEEIVLEEQSLIPTAPETINVSRRITRRTVILAVVGIFVLAGASLLSRQIVASVANDAGKKGSRSLEELVDALHFYTRSTDTQNEKPMAPALNGTRISTSDVVKEIRLRLQQHAPNRMVKDGHKSFELETQNPGKLKVHTFAQDEDFKQLVGRKDLSVLDIDRAGFLTGEGMKYLEKLPLKEIFIDQTNMGDRALEHFSKIATLEALFIVRASSITDDGLKHLRNLKHLSSFELVDSQITDVGVRYLSEVKTLGYLSVMRNADITDDCINALNTLPNLRALALSYTSITADGITRVVCSRRRLTELRIDGLPCSPASFKALSRLSHLETLSMADTTVTNEMLPKLLDFRHLINVNIEGRQLSGASLAVLKDHATLSRLDIRNPTVSNTMLRALGSLKVEVLGMERPVKLNDAQLVLLLGMPNLKLLTLRDCDHRLVTLRGMQTFQKSYLQRWKRKCDIEYDSRTADFP